MSFEYKSRPLDELIRAIQRHEVVLPNFQRSFVWKADQIRSLFASFLVGVPIGSLLTLKGRTGDFAARELTQTVSVTLTGDHHCEYLLDGQQRLTALRTTLFDLFEDRTKWRKTWDDSFHTTRTRWFIRVTSDPSLPDVLGYRHLSFTDLRRLEPSFVEDAIVHERIKKTVGLNLWYHPAQKLRTEEGEVEGEAATTQALARTAAEQQLIPLWAIGYLPEKNKGRPRANLLEKVIDLLAQRRQEQLEARYADGDPKIRKDLEKVLSEVDERFTSYVAKGEDRKQLKVWTMLSARWAERVKTSLGRLLKQDLSVTIAPSDELARAIATFEAINKGGTALSVFDLVVARAALNTEEAHLTERLVKGLRREIEIPAHVVGTPEPVSWQMVGMQPLSKDGLPQSTVKEWFLNILSIRCQAAKGGGLRTEHIKRNKILSLTEAEINTNAASVIKALRRACAFLQFRCGIVAIGDLNYKLMLVPIAMALMDDSVWNSPADINHLEYWYWVRLFAGDFMIDQNETAVSDVDRLRQWLQTPDASYLGESEKLVLARAQYSDLDTLLPPDGGSEDHKVPKAIRLGLLQWVLSRTPSDFADGVGKRLTAWQAADTDEDLRLEDHHVIPLFTAKSLGQSTTELRKDSGHVLNSPLNRTYISREMNKKIGQMDPRNYLQQIDPVALAQHHFADLTGFVTTPDGGWRPTLVDRFHRINSQLRSELATLRPTHE